MVSTVSLSMQRMQVNPKFWPPYDPLLTLSPLNWMMPMSQVAKFVMNGMLTLYRTNKNQALLYGLYHGHPGVVAQLLPGADLSDFPWNPLWLAYLSGNFELFQMAAMSPAITSKHVSNMVDTHGLSLPQLRILLERPDIDFSKGEALTERIPHSTQEIDKPDTLLILDAFYRHPRMNPVEFFDALVYDDDRGASQIPVDLMITWLADARLDPTEASDKFYEQLVWFWPPEVLQFFVQQFPSPAVKDTSKQCLYEFTRKPGSE